MHLLYVDEAGSAGDAGQTHFVLAGVSLFERQGYWIASELDNLVSSINPADPAPLELHGSPMLGVRKYGDSIQKINAGILLKKLWVFCLAPINPIEFLPVS